MSAPLVAVPALVEYQTRTEWGVRYGDDGWTHYAESEYIARTWMRVAVAQSLPATLMSREVITTAWVPAPCRCQDGLVPAAPGVCTCSGDVEYGHDPDCGWEHCPMGCWTRLHPQTTEDEVPY